MICVKCGFEMQNGLHACPSCGAKIELPPGTIFGDVRIRGSKKKKERSTKEVKRSKRNILIGFCVFAALFIAYALLEHYGIIEELKWAWLRFRYPADRSITQWLGLCRNHF